MLEILPDVVAFFAFLLFFSEKDGVSKLVIES